MCGLNSFKVLASLRSVILLILISAHLQAPSTTVRYQAANVTNRCIVRSTFLEVARVIRLLRELTHSIVLHLTVLLLLLLYVLLYVLYVVI